MEQEGFTFKDGKYVCVKAPGQERFARLKTIGDNYTPENISKRIAEARGEKIEKFSRSFYNLSVEIRTHAGAYSITKPIKDMCGTLVDYCSTCSYSDNGIRAIMPKNLLFRYLHRNG